MILREVLVTNKRRIANNCIEKAVLKEVFLTVGKEIPYMDLYRRKCATQGLETFSSFLRFLRVKFNALHESWQSCAFCSTVDQRFSSRFE